jgi:hypothetical protein
VEFEHLVEVNVFYLLDLMTLTNSKYITMKFLVILVLGICCATISHAQKYDYKILRDSLTRLSCKPTDSVTVAKVNRELLNIDTSLIDKNIHIYYSDLAWSYYRMYLFSKDTNQVRSSISNYKNSDFHKPNSAITYWQLAFLYLILEDCDKGLYYLERHIAVSEEEYLRHEQIQLLRDKCGT